MSTILHNHSNKNEIKTSQAIADTFTKKGKAILTEYSIFINEKPEQLIKDFSVTINSIDAEKVTINSDWVKNKNYVFLRKTSTIENSIDDNIVVGANEGTVKLKPHDWSSNNYTTLTIYGAADEYGSWNRGTASLNSYESNIWLAGTIEIKTRPTCEMRWLYFTPESISDERITDLENFPFPYNTTHPFTYKVNGGNDRMMMYEPGAAYYIGKDNQGLPLYFTVSSTGTIWYIKGYGEKPSQSMDTDGREYNAINFHFTDRDVW